MAWTLEQIIDNRLGQTAFSEKLAMIEQIRDLLFDHEMDALLEEAEDPRQTAIPICPKCGSMSTSRHGYANGRQRHRCRGCGRTFVQARRRSVIASSHLPKSTWMRFINCFVDSLPVAACAERCQVTVSTAYAMRLRVLSVIEQTMGVWALETGVRAQIDETFVYESFKGNRTGCKDFEMPRASFKRSRKGKGGTALGGISASNHFCVMSGVAETREAFFEVSGRGTMSSEDCKRVLEGKLHKGCYVTTDDHHSYVGVLQSVGANHASLPSTDTEGELNRVNALHSCFKDFMRRKRGVSSRRLNLYLAEFSWRWEACKGETARTAVSKIVEKIARIDFKTKLSDFKASPYPLIEWWQTEEGKMESRRLELLGVQRGIRKARKEAEGDDDMMSVVNERQAAFERAVAEEGFEIGEKGFVKAPQKQTASPVRLTMGMLQTQ